jgi:nicotinate-nucleotide adenylyltransferase
MHIAVMGGTFDPIHYGHLRVAEEVREDFGLDRVIFIPAYIPPHKPDEGKTPPELRIEMVRLAVAGNPGFEVSSIEIERGGKSYTIETVKELKKKGEKDLEISLIMGTDSFNDITSWMDYRELLELANIIVVPRPGYAAEKLAEALPVELARKFRYDSATESYINLAGRSVTYLETARFDISSSDIRRRVKEGRSIRYLLPPQVADHIAKHGLYK